MPRVIDANILFAGTEPKFNVELTPIQMLQTLSWYSQNKDKKDAFKWACDYFKKFYKADVSSIVKDKISTFGFVCRIVSNGGILSIKDQIWFDDEVQKIKDELVVLRSQTPTSKITTAVVINIQDRIREKADNAISELEWQIDELITSGFKANTQPYAVFHTLDIKDAQTKYIIEWAKSKRKEFDSIADDDDLKEGYSNFSKSEIKKLIAYFDQVILDCGRVSQTKTKSRKIRKRKQKTPEQLIAKMNYMPEFKELKLKSIVPTEIIGVMQLWIYNTKTRKLGVYQAEDAGGLSVKGSTITNFAESKSVQKKLRKPEAILPEVINGGKVFLRNVLNDIRAVESSLTGRINSDTILLRVMK